MFGSTNRRQRARWISLLNCRVLWQKYKLWNNWFHIFLLYRNQIAMLLWWTVPACGKVSQSVCLEWDNRCNADECLCWRVLLSKPSIKQQYGNHFHDTRSRTPWIENISQLYILFILFGGCFGMSLSFRLDYFTRLVIFIRRPNSSEHSDTDTIVCHSVKVIAEMFPWTATKINTSDDFTCLMCSSSTKVPCCQEWVF